VNYFISHLGEGTRHKVQGTRKIQGTRLKEARKDFKKEARKIQDMADPNVEQIKKMLSSIINNRG